MANPEHVEVVKQGAEAIRKWREANPDVPIDLSGADFSKANLCEANLAGAHLDGANLTQANLTQAHLDGADLRRARFLATCLSGANLSRADLSMAFIIVADLSKANLTGSNLGGTLLFVVDLWRANLSGTIFEQVKMMGTVFGDVDLSTAKSLDTVKHEGPSTIGIDTLYKSRGKIPEVFLRGCGLQPWEILAAKLYDTTLTPPQIKGIQDRIFSERTKEYFFGGIFISYSRQDSDFVDKVYARLKQEGANVWLDRHDMVAGPLQKQVFQGIRLNDVVLLVLSESSIKSDWVENELDMARCKEKEQSRDVLCPIALDDSWKAKVQDKELDDRHLWRTLTKKNILDFSEWRSDGFEEPFRKLLDGIKRYYGTAEGNA